MLLQEGLKRPGSFVGYRRHVHSWEWGFFLLLGCPVELFDLVRGHRIGRPIIGLDVTHGHFVCQPQEHGAQVHHLDG